MRAAASRMRWPSQTAFLALSGWAARVPLDLLAVRDGPDRRDTRAASAPAQRARRAPARPLESPRGLQRRAHGQRAPSSPRTNASAAARASVISDVGDHGRPLGRRSREHERQAQESHEAGGPAQEAEDLRPSDRGRRRAPPRRRPACRGGGRARRGGPRAPRPSRDEPAQEEDGDRRRHHRRGRSRRAPQPSTKLAVAAERERHREGGEARTSSACAAPRARAAPAARRRATSRC